MWACFREIITLTSIPEYNTKKGSTKWEWGDGFDS